MSCSQSNRKSLEDGVAPPCVASQAVSEAKLAWKAPSLAAASEALPGSIYSRSEDARFLLVLLSFLMTSEKLPVDLLSRGASPRRRWTMQGKIEETDAVRAGLAPELQKLISNNQGLGDAFYELELSSVVSRNATETYTLNETIACRVRESLSPELLSFWRFQALTIAYRAIPWKYIDSTTPNTRLFLPFLKHTLEEIQDSIEHLPLSTRADLVLALIESSRFPNMAWKRFAVGQAEVAARGLEDDYIHSRIKQSQSLLSRITGDIDQAVSSLRSLGQDRQPPHTVDRRMHSTIGHATIQQSLNCIQVEDLSVAKNLLENWRPLAESPSLMEEVVVFRKDMILGRLLRLQGDFEESRAHLERARDRAEQRKDIIFDEDLRDLTCDYADTLRELNEPASAEHHLRVEIERQALNCASFSGRSLLELSLAEALFGQGRFKDAENLCLDVQSRPGLLKFESLRLYIILAKIRQVNSDNEDALCYWSKALKAAGNFHLTNGRTSRVIAISICDTLRCMGHGSLVRDPLEEATVPNELAQSGGVQYWIAGLRHWLEYVQSRGLRGPM